MSPEVYAAQCRGSSGRSYTFAARCPAVLLCLLHLPLLHRNVILELARFSSVVAFLIPLPVISSCRSYLV